MLYIYIYVFDRSPWHESLAPFFQIGGSGPCCKGRCLWDRAQSFDPLWHTPFTCLPKPTVARPSMCLYDNCCFVYDAFVFSPKGGKLRMKLLRNRAGIRETVEESVVSPSGSKIWLNGNENHCVKTHRNPEYMHIYIYMIYIYIYIYICIHV